MAITASDGLSAMKAAEALAATGADDEIVSAIYLGTEHQQTIMVSSLKRLLSVLPRRCAERVPVGGHGRERPWKGDDEWKGVGLPPAPSLLRPRPQSLLFRALRDLWNTIRTANRF